MEVTGIIIIRRVGSTRESSFKDLHGMLGMLGGLIGLQYILQTESSRFGLHKSFKFGLHKSSKLG